jgi:hypothetical protein
MSAINSGVSGSYLPGGSNFNPFVTPMINQAISPIMQGLSQATNWSLPAEFAANGQAIQDSRLGNDFSRGGSSAFTNAEALAVQSAANAAATVAANVENNAYNTGAQMTTTFATLQPAEVQAMVNGLQSNLLPTLLQQQGITNGLQSFQDNVNSLVNFLSTISTAVQPTVGNASQSISAGESTQAGQGTSNSQSTSRSVSQGTSTGTNTPGIIPDISGVVSALKPSAPSTPSK